MFLASRSFRICPYVFFSLNSIQLSSQVSVVRVAVRIINRNAMVAIPLIFFNSAMNGAANAILHGWQVGRVAGGGSSIAQLARSAGEPWQGGGKPPAPI
jgi:hypothetical protein